MSDDHFVRQGSQVQQETDENSSSLEESPPSVFSVSPPKEVVAEPLGEIRDSVEQAQEATASMKTSGSMHAVLGKRGEL